MSVIIARQICRKEFGQGKISSAEQAIILEAYRRGSAGLAAAIKSGPLAKNSRLIKIYATTARGPRRLLFLFDAISGDAFLLFYRDKHDALGRNMSSQNPLLKKTLRRYLELLRQDIKSGQIIEFKT